MESRLRARNDMPSVGQRAFGVPVRMKRSSVILALIPLLCLPALSGKAPRPFDPDEPFAFLSWSPDGTKLAIGRQDGSTILLYDRATGKVTDLVTGRASGNWFTWSPDESAIGYKLVERGWQGAVAKHLAAGAVAELAAGPLVGQPAWLDDTTIVVTEGRSLLLISGQRRKRWDIGSYVNQVAVDRVGRRAALCAGNRLMLVGLDDGTVRVIHAADADLHAPSFSPDGRSILFSSVDGEARIIELETGRVRHLGQALSATWIDGRRAMFTRKSHDTMALVKSELVTYDLQTGFEDGLVLDGVIMPGMAASGGGWLAVASLDDGRLKIGRWDRETKSVGMLQTVDLGSLSEPRWAGQGDLDAAPKGLVPGWMPYIHQAYDTPDSFDGSAACGPTSCLMAIGYYHRYAVWNETVHITANPPGDHVSPYGNYDSKIYTYGGYVFDDTCSPPTGPPAHGAYGYCCTHGAGAWAYKCRDYIRKHDLESDYDLSVTWDDVVSQINSGYPVVLSTAITSAGHLMCVRGHVDGQHTIIVNDPAGNRNNGPYWNYPGDTARYDWPGYNNGYVNINSASWLVTARGRHTRLALVDFPDTVDAGHYYTVTFTDTTSRYQANNTFFVDVCDGASGDLVSTGSRTGLNDSLGGIWNIFNLTAPRSSSTVYFKTYLVPAGGTYDTRYISAWTNSHPTVVKQVAIRDDLINPGFESGLWPWADTENADLTWDGIGHGGAKSLKLVPRVLTDYVPAVAHQDVRVVPGQSYVFSGWARKNDGCGNSVRLAFMWYAAADTQIGSQIVSPWLTSDDEVFHYLATPAATAPAGAAYACLRLYVKGYAPVGDNFDDLYFGDPSGVAGPGPQEQSVFEFRMEGNSPEPCSGPAVFRYQLPEACEVKLTVYNINGQLVRAVKQGRQPAGRHEIRWDGRNLSGNPVGCGVYIYRLAAHGRSATGRMTVVR